MWRKLLPVVCLIVCSISVLHLPSNCNTIRLNKIRLPLNTNVAAMKNATKIESSIDRISKLGRSLTVCPFILKENQMDNRIPSTFYEMECLQCNKCGKNGSKCTQLVTEMKALFWEADDSTWTEILTVKVGCTCSPVSGRSPARFLP